MASVYPFDPSGTSTANRIANEQHVITAQNFRDYHYVIPHFAPFFEGDFTISLKYRSGAVRPLKYGVDYYFSNQFLDASRACSKPLFGSISFLDTDTEGVLSISYNTVGGDWNITKEEISRILAEELRNPRTTTWEQITYLPARFPVVDHEWDLVDMVGVTPLIAGLQEIRGAILAASGGGLGEHVNNYSNPHNVTKGQVGLGDVQNYPVATLQQAQDGTSNGFYMTPLRVADAIQAQAGAMLNTHSSNTNNPHGTTKGQVGLGNVLNYGVATQSQAEAGALDTLYMTPLKTAQAVAALVGNAYSAHANNKQNPHNVTKDQVGLFNVQNYAVASQEEARLGAANDRYMTPLRTSQLVSEFVTTRLNDHTDRIDNPHDVTKTQVGLGDVENYAIATQQEATDAISNTLYMTPGRTRDTIDALATPIAHLDDMANPHEVTKEQIGLGSVQNFPIASQAEAQAAVVNNRYMTPLRTREMVAEFVTSELDGHATRFDNPHAVSKAQVGLAEVQNFPIASSADVQAAASNNHYMTPVRTWEAVNRFATPFSHLADKTNPHAVTAEQVGAYSRIENDTLMAGYVRVSDDWVAGKTKAECSAEVLTGKAANSALLDGKTIDQIIAQASGFYDGEFAQTDNRYSRDGATTADPVASPYRWIMLGEVTTLSNAETASVNSMAVTTPDAYWFLSGGQKQGANAVDNAKTSSPGYLIHAKNGLAADAHSFDVTRLNGTVDSDVKFGYTYDAAASTMQVWVRVSHGYNDLNVTRLTALANSLTVESAQDTVVVEPAAITYVNPVSYATSAQVEAMNERLTAMEETINSVAVV